MKFKLTPKSLAIAVFVLAVLCSFWLIDFPVAIIKGELNRIPITAARLVVWIGLVTGGVGLIRGRDWGRKLVMVVSAVDLGLVVAEDMFGGAVAWLDNTYGIQFGAYAYLIAILYAAWKVQLPAGSTPVTEAAPDSIVPRKPGFRLRSKLDFLYACHLLVGVTTAVAILVSLLGETGSFGQMWGEFLGMAVLAPLLVLTAIVVLLIIVLSLILTGRWFRDKSVPLLLILLVASGIATGWGVATDAFPEPYLTLLLMPYTVLSFALSLRWFFRTPRAAEPN